MQRQLVLIDTDVIIDVSRKIDSAISTVDQLRLDSVLAISVITKLELIAGCRNKYELRQLSGFLDYFDLINIDESVCDKAVELFYAYRLSHGVQIPDMLIASTALV